MRKILLVTIAGLVTASLMTPAVGATSQREDTREYTMASGLILQDSSEAHWTIGTEYQAFRPKAGERFVSFAISDNSGMPARGHIHMDANADGKLDKVDDFCGATEDPILIGKATKIEIGVILGTCPDNSPAFVTTGSITATFTK